MVSFSPLNCAISCEECIFWIRAQYHGVFAKIKWAQSKLKLYCPVCQVEASLSCQNIIIQHITRNIESKYFRQQNKVLTNLESRSNLFHMLLREQSRYDYEIIIHFKTKNVWAVNGKFFFPNFDQRYKNTPFRASSPEHLQRCNTCV